MRPPPANKERHRWPQKRGHSTSRRLVRRPSSIQRGRPDFPPGHLSMLRRGRGQSAQGLWGRIVGPCPVGAASPLRTPSEKVPSSPSSYLAWGGRVRWACVVTICTLSPPDRLLSPSPASPHLPPTAQNYLRPIPQSAPLLSWLYCNRLALYTARYVVKS